MSSKVLSEWTTFQTPALQVDFADPSTQEQMNLLWNDNLQGFTSQGITGNPWTATNSSDQILYFNPTMCDVSGGTYSQITWSPVPGRISYYFPTMANDDIWSLADTGYDTKGRTFGQIPRFPCDPTDKTTKPYGPYGPRGWQDEYCEWSVTRNQDGAITRIDFTCENPEYWNSLWSIDPNRVLELYQQTLDKPQILLTDLYLMSSNGPVIDPSTGRPAYNPLNKWNSGPVSTSSGGGAMHLTSTPNTLQTEIGLASTATTPRSVGNTSAQTLICCAQYGQPGRNSDPHIGQIVNQAVTPVIPGPSSVATLANPPGLYIQTPDLARITCAKDPDFDASQWWTVRRGTKSLTDGNGNSMPGQFILHAVFEPPAGSNLTISDLQVDTVDVQWAAQIAQTFDMQIAAMTLPLQPAPAAQPCAGTPDGADTQAQALQLFHAAVFEAMAATTIPNPVGQQMSLLSNSTLIPPVVMPGDTAVPMILVLAEGTNSSNAPSVSFGDGITVCQSGSITSVTYAIPGNTYPAVNWVLPILVDVATTAEPGTRGALVSNPGQASTIPMPALLRVGS
jgi:hypothetical protein